MEQKARTRRRRMRSMPLAVVSSPFLLPTVGQMTEMRTWILTDKHAICRQRVEPMTMEQMETKVEELKATKANLTQQDIEAIEDWVGPSNVVSWIMCKKLGYDVRTSVGYARFRENCLTCHGGYKPQTEDPEFSRENGVPGLSCTYCHENGNSVAWRREHGENIWRLKSVDEKQLMGLRHLGDCQQQVELCASCHVGDPESGKFVTHDMYVAGHPPLPGFDLQQFSDAMPRHWRDHRDAIQVMRNLAEDTKLLKASRDKMPELIDLYLQTNLPKGVSDQIKATKDLQDVAWSSRTVLISAVASARQYANLLANSRRVWGDYALYDCSACHHELRVPSHRQNRTVGEIPGRPRLVEWVNPVLEVAQQWDTNGLEVQRTSQTLSKAVNSVPFGSAPQCIDEAKKLRDALVNLERSLTERTFASNDAKRLFLQLTEIPTEKVVEYNAARQIVWALKESSKDIRDFDRTKLESLGRTGGESWIEDVLPAGRTGNLFSRTQTSFITKELARIRKYEPEKFAEQLKALAKEFAEAK